MVQSLKLKKIGKKLKIPDLTEFLFKFLVSNFDQLTRSKNVGLLMM